MSVLSPIRPAPPTAFPRMLRLDGLRGVLAIYVMLGHAAPMVPWPGWMRPLVEALVSHGFAAVNLFFALSGLVIVQSLARFENRALPFLAARARRILPVYLVVLGAAILILRLRSPLNLMPWAGVAAQQIWENGLPQPFWAHLATHLTLTQGVIPHHLLPYNAFSLLGPAWSLSAEMQFYILIALLARWITPGRRHFTDLASAFAMLALAGWAYREAAPEAWQFSRAFLPNVSIYFALGIASVPLLRDNRGGAQFALIALVAMLLGAGSGTMWRVFTPAAWTLCLFIQKRPEILAFRPAALALESPVMRWFGAISYPLYLVNEPVQRGLALAVLAFTGKDPGLFGLIWTPLALATPVAAAAALHVFVERKFMTPRQRRNQATGADAFSAVS